MLNSQYASFRGLNSVRASAAFQLGLTGLPHAQAALLYTQ